MELGKKIRQLRLKASMTQEQLAERLGVGPQAVSKWENAMAMPDITLLPLLAETFGVSIDDLFDLTVEQRLNRIENRLDVEDELSQDVFWEYEEYLKTRLADEEHKERATELIAYLCWHMMEAYASKVRHYAKDAVRLSPQKKGCQWMLQKAEGHVVWDWNVANHTAAIDFYRELVEQNPGVRMPLLYLLDNLIADHRVDEAEECLGCLSALGDSNPILNEVYRAHIALARFDEKMADGFIERLVDKHQDDHVALFEAAQYFAAKCDYERAIDLYERAFEAQGQRRRPRFYDELMGIATIYQIMGDYRKAAETYGRIIGLLQDEWGMTEEVELRRAVAEKARLLAMA